MADPRPRTAQKPDGSLDHDLERRLEVIFHEIQELRRRLEALERK